MLGLILVVAVVSLMFYLVVAFAPKGWRTIVFNSVAALPLIGGELASVLTNFDWGKVISNSQTAALLGLAVLVANVVLRTVTSTPVGQHD